MTENYPRSIRVLRYFTHPDGGVSGALVAPGDVLTITPRVYEQTLDDNGDSWLHLTSEEQSARWGTPRFEVLEETS